MKNLPAALGKLIGIHFAPDNHVIPILHLGRYHRVRGPGYFWIIPLLQQTLPPVKTSLYVGKFVFEEVLSQENIPFKIKMTVLFSFNPALALKNAAAQLVRGGEGLLQTIVSDFTDRRLRRLVATFRAEELSADTVIAKIEAGLVHYLNYEMSSLGLKLLKTKDGGAMIKEVVAPLDFKRTMLDVKHDESILEILLSYPAPELVQLLNQLIFVNSLKGRSGELTLMMGLPENKPALPFLEQNKD